MICKTGGEVYDVAFYKDKVYAVSYDGGDIIEYDPSQPWDKWNAKNPKIIKKLSPKWIRPSTGIVIGPDNKLYSTWWAAYGKYGGAVAITDPETGDTQTIENPLGEQALEGVATDGKFVYIGSSLNANGLPDKAGESPKFGMVEIATHKVVFEQAFADSGVVRIMAHDPKSKRVAFCVDGKVELFDTEKRVILPEMPDETSRTRRQSFGVPGDGCVYYGNWYRVIKLDMATGKTTVVAEAPNSISNMAAGADGKLYFSCGVDVYAVKP